MYYLGMKTRNILIISILAFLFASCTTTKQNAIQEKSDYIEEDPVEIVSDDIEEVFDVEDEVLDISNEDEEYLRSINDIETSDEIVSVQEFNDDKAEILSIINELSDVMKNFEFENWKTYMSPASLEYYTNPVNLRKAQKKLPDKTIQLKGLKDYFKYVFIPSRKVSKVEEIRYISKNYTKAVEVREDGTTVVYYYFVKENGKWKVKLPDIS